MEMVHADMYIVNMLGIDSKCSFELGVKSMSNNRTSTTRYPLCLAATCASVVFPSPGGPQSNRICNNH